MSLTSDEPLYMGVDIESGKPGSTNARYSIAIVDSKGKLVLKSSSATISRIIRFAWEYRPKKIGVDNVFELASTIPKLHKLLNLLPPETEIVQVNVIEDHFMPLKEATKIAGIALDSPKLNSMKTAYMVAILASKGLGTPVFMEEKKTIITVSKGRGSKRGGMSQGRYQRRVRASVLHAAKKIKEILDKAGIEYDMHIKEGRGGLDRAVFVVYAPRRKLYGLIKPHRGLNYNIKIRTVYGKKIVIGNSNVNIDRPIIVGVDPGIMVGIAILDLEGNVLYLNSEKGIDRGSLIELISKFGRPVIIAVDTPEVPDAVKAIAAKFQASIFSPAKPLPVSEKIELSKQALDGKVPNTQHERDALAAAYKALSTLQSKLSQVDAYLAKIDVDIDYDRVKEAVLRGSTVAEAVEAELQRLISDESEACKPRNEVITQRTDETSTKIKSLLDKIDELTAKVKVLEQKNLELKELVERYEREISRLRVCEQGVLYKYQNDKEIEKLKSSIKLLQDEIEKRDKLIEDLKKENEMLLKSLIAIAYGKKLLVRTLPSLTLTAIKRSEKTHGPLRPGEVLYVTNAGTYEIEAIKYIVRSNVLAVLLDEKDTNLSNSLRKFKIPSFKITDYSPTKIKEYYIIVDSKIIDDALKEKERLESRRDESNIIDLDKIIEEYRRERLRDLKRLGEVRNLK
jgi:predicted RNase H-like nuclease (RuvC/YqgF family)